MKLSEKFTPFRCHFSYFSRKC